MHALTAPLSELAEIEEICEERGREPGMLLLSGCVTSQKTHLMYALGKDYGHTLIVLSSEDKAKKLYEEYRFLNENTSYYPAKDLLFYQADIHGKQLVKQRMETLQMMMEAKSQVTVITTIDGFMDELPSEAEIKGDILTISNGEALEFESLKEKIIKLGYDREAQVDGPGQFAVRGGIIDIYPLTEELPIRIEFWGDEVDSIRTFDVDSQRSVENLEQIVIYPADDRLGSDRKVSFINYFDPKDTLVFLDEPARLLEKGRLAENEVEKARENRAEEMERTGEMEEAPEFFTTDEIIKFLNKFCMIGMCALEMKCKPFFVKKRFGIQAKSVNPYNSSFEMLTQDLKRLKRNGYRAVLISGSRTRAKRLAEDLRDYDLSSFYSEDQEREVNPGEIMVCYGHIEVGYEYPMIKFIVISESDIFGKTKKKKKRKSYDGQKISSFSDLKPGDYVVHENHGLGIYRGIEKIEVDKVTKDYMKISYADGGNLYILATQLDQIQKYASADAKKPKLNKLGGQEWHRTKSKVKTAVWQIAKDLVELYAVRQSKEGFVYEKDTVWQKEFEEMFPYEETEDQLSAIEDAKRDMESTRIMDRLICGDVGYGKTEVALRAAFKEVQESRQVAYLAPTTILAQQIYNTFVQRMKEFPVRVELLCRFRTPAQQKKAIEDLKKGQVDVIIGTHRILSKDVQFKNLGLLIVDEEQRFGVTHKEKIKQLKKDVDVLTLTATPIPRTLHMSLIGIRDMSVLEEPPMDRMPIQTYVMEYDEETVREAINRELRRGGQVYYVYNRVTDIADVALRIAKLVPDARVDFAHGQMSERELENVMYSFVNGDIDVLVSTTIIETGLDISNVNTMIIHDSDRYGLSQLYQLRGRIGRSNRTAYAFLMYRKNVMLKETAEKRLAAIREYTDLGSGFKIAMRDLELRGAGNLLGAQQHGHMNAVGYDLYCKMLNEAVKEAKGIHTMEDFETSVDLNVDAYIPDSYISNEFQKLDIYKRIAGIETQQDYDDMLEELLDRFGEPGKAVLNLLAIAKLKAIAHQGYVTEIKQTGKTVRFTLYEKARLNTEGFPALMQKYRRGLQFKNEQEPKFILEPQGNLILALTEFAEELKSMAENM